MAKTYLLVRWSFCASNSVSAILGDWVGDLMASIVSSISSKDISELAKPSLYFSGHSAESRKANIDWLRCNQWAYSVCEWSEWYDNNDPWSTGNYCLFTTRQFFISFITHLRETIVYPFRAYYILVKIMKGSKGRRRHSLFHESESYEKRKAYNTK